MSEAAKTRQTIWRDADTATADSSPGHPGEFVQRAAAGDRAAQQALFQELFPLIYKHLGFVLGFGPMVEDAVQDSMLQIHRALPGFRGESSVTTWALAIASRTATRHAMRERKHRSVTTGAVAIDELGPTLFAPADVAASTELRLLVKALARLTVKKRLAFVLIALLDCSATEAGEILGISPNTAASQFRHARQELLDHMERHGSA